MKKKLAWKFGFIAAVIGLCVYAVYPPKEKIRLGLDLKGGMHLVLKVDSSKVAKEAQYNVTEKVKSVIERRINELGVVEPVILTEGKERIIVQLPGISDRERAIKLIGKTALLEFKLVSEDYEKLQEAVKGNVQEGLMVANLRGDEKNGFSQIPMLVSSETALTGANLVTAYKTYGSDYNQPEVALKFDKKGAAIFADLTRKNIQRKLAILLDGEILTAPVIQTEIPNGEARITGRFTENEASDLSTLLAGGALPAPVSIIEDRTVSPTLGSDSVKNGLYASLIGFLMVVFFIQIYYLVPGMFANFALLLNIVMLVGLLGAIGATLTLPGIAGIALTMGMAVDANVLINERIREEMGLGKKIRTAITLGYQRAFVTILDSNLTTIFAAAMLFFFGTGPVRGFAVTLTLGILASFFTAIFATRCCFDTLTLNKSVEKIKMLSLFGKTNFDFMSKRFIFFTVSIIFTIAGIIAFINRGSAFYGVDFSGGDMIHIKTASAVPLDDLRASLKDIKMESCTIQHFGADNEYIIRAPLGTTDSIVAHLDKTYKDRSLEVLRREQVGPAIGADLRRDALWATLGSLLLILIYVAFRFKFQFGVAAIVATAHDTLVVIGAMAIAGCQFDLTTLAAVLTVIGYSLNDTIVVFDRIRENLKLTKKKNMYELINLSINQTLARTVITSTVVFVLIALYVWGGSVLHDFAFTMLVGVVTGTYSSIFIASPLLLIKGKAPQAA